MTGAPPQLLRDALAHHKAGRLDQAEAGYRQVLDADPNQPDALNLFGVLCIQKGAPEQGVEAMTRAAALRPNEPSILANLGAALLETGQPLKATDYLRRALSLEPRNMEALYNLANALYASGRPGEAETLFHQVIAAEPGFPPAYNNLALCLLAREAHEEALSALRKAVELDPSYTEALANLGATLTRMERHDEAVAQLEKAVAANPGYADAHNHLGAALTALERFEEADRRLNAALDLAPNDVEIHLNVGNLHSARNDVVAAEASYRRAVELAPDSASAQNNMGGVLNRMGDFQAALPHLTEALRLRPDHAGTLNNLGIAWCGMGRYDDAMHAYNRALAIDPDEHDARLGRAFIHLLHGRFADGWPDYRARETMQYRTDLANEAPLEADLAGRRILVEYDQGLGDELFFLRFLPELRSRGAHVAYLPDARLAAMLTRAGLADEIVSADAPTDAYHMRVSVGDLPYLLGADAPAPSIALTPLTEKAAEADRRLAALGPPPYVGVTWRAGTKRRDRDLYKETPLEGLARLLSGVDATVVVLQRLPEPGEVDTFSSQLGRPAGDLTALNTDLEMMLALMGVIDGYVGVSNTNVHLRAARGLTSLVLVPNPPEFRWMADGPESPWFTGTGVFRQTPDGDWSAALKAIADELTKSFG